MHGALSVPSACHALGLLLRCTGMMQLGDREAPSLGSLHSVVRL